MKYIFNQKWREIHLKRLKIHTKTEFDDYCCWIRELAANFPCEMCERHFLEYIDENPPEKGDHPFICA